ncbi:MAG TPA: GNAT family N-acetyltransferase [Tepidiformaceae bacterium]|nr:GNAT family N-acetyltransferase [Tepidiformaceae bacterium]
MTSVMPVAVPTIEGNGLVLRGWDDDLAEQVARWGERGFPYHAFDLGHLRDPFSRTATLARFRDTGSHRHYIACEDGVAVGRVSVNMRDDAGLYLWSVHVPPEHAGRGVCRRMLAALMTQLEFEYPGRDFVLSSNTFATNAHRAYEAVGFRIAETRWHHDREIAEKLWKVPHQARAPIATHIRFQNGRWEVRTYVMRRKARAPMHV